MRAIGQRELGDSASPRRLQGLHGDTARSDDQHAPVAEIAERPLGECQRHRARRRGVGSDAGLGACATTRRESRAEEQREHRPGRSGRASLGERITDLPEDLGFAEHERVEAGGDAREMARDVLAGVDVQVVGEQAPVDPVRPCEDADQLLARLLDPAREVRVELDPVAGA